MAGLQFDVSGAQAAGYSDADIVQHIAGMKDQGFDVNGALKAGYTPTEIVQHLNPTPSGFGANLQEGAADAASGLSKTAEVVGGGPGRISQGLKSVADWARPADFVPSSIIDKAGFHPSAILPNLARAAAPTAATILAGMAAPEVLGTAGAVAAGTGAGLAMNAGNQIQTAADNRTGQPNSPITGPDAIRGGLTSVAQAVPQALPMGRYLAPAGALEKTGMAGVIDAAKGLTKTAASQGGASAASDIAGQVGQTVGTPAGTTVDPTQVANAGATGLVTGGLFGTKRAAASALNATAMRGFKNDPELMQAGTQVANRIQQNADGGNLNAGIVGGGTAQRLGAESFTKTGNDITSELNASIGKLQAPLPVDAQNVLNAALKGQQPTEGGYKTLGAALASDPQGPNVMNLVRQAHAMDIFGGLGNVSNGKFTGGIASHITGMLTGHNVAKTGLVALGGAALEGGAGHLIAYSPEVMAGVAGAGALARLADSVTGARAPAGRIVSNFADGTTPVRLPQPVPAQATAAPAAPVVRPGPTGPAIAPPPAPWAGGPPPRPQPAPFTPRPVAGGTMLTPQIQATMAARANLAKIAAAQRQVPTAPAAPAPINPLMLPKEITGPAKNIMAGAAAVAKQKSEALGQDAAAAQVATSPFIEQKVGSAANIPTPQAARAMSKAVSGANILAKLQSDPEAQAEAAAQAKTEAAQAKAAVQTAKAQAKLAAKAPAAKPAEDDGSVLPNGFATSLRQPVDLPGDFAATLRKLAVGPETIKKANGQTTVNNEPFPSSSYAHLPAQVAATHITNAAQAAGNVKFPQGFRASTQARIQGERDLMARLGADAPDLPIANLTGRLEGAPDQKTAKEFREHLTQVYPHASAAINKHLSDEAIGRLWTRKQAPKS